MIDDIFDFRFWIFDWGRRTVLMRIARMGVNDFNAKAQRCGGAKGNGSSATTWNVAADGTDFTDGERGEDGWEQEQTKGDISDWQTGRGKTGRREDGRRCLPDYVGGCGAGNAGTEAGAAGRRKSRIVG